MVFYFPLYTFEHVFFKSMTISKFAFKLSKSILFLHIFKTLYICSLNSHYWSKL